MDTQNLITLGSNARRVACSMSNAIDYADRIRTLTDELTGIQERAENITDTATNQNRDLTAGETNLHEGLMLKFQSVRNEVTRLEEMQGNDNYLRQPANLSAAPSPNPVDPQHGGLVNHPHKFSNGVGFHSGVGSDGIVPFKNIVTGEIVNGVRGAQPLFNENAGLPLGDVLHGILLNDLSGLPSEVRNTVSTGADTSGGYMFAPAMSQQVIDLARANMACVKAGAVTLPMAAGEMQFARLDSDATITTRGELGAVTASAPGFGRYTLKPKTIAALVPVSMETLEDVPNAGQVIEQALINAIAVEADRQMLEGTGASAEILGIANNAGINSATGIGTPTTYGEVSTAVRDVFNSNFAGDASDLAWISNPLMSGTYDQLVTGISSDNTPLLPTPWVSQLQRLHTTSLAANGSSEHNSIVGNFSEMLIGMRTSGVVIDVLDSGSVVDENSDTWNATTQFMRFIRARIRVDMLLMQPSHFSVMSGLTT